MADFCGADYAADLYEAHLRKVQMRLPRPQGGWASVKRIEAWRRTRRSWQRRLQLSVLAQYPPTDC